jgi:hypothetical protein
MQRPLLRHGDDTHASLSVVVAKVVVVVAEIPQLVPVNPCWQVHWKEQEIAFRLHCPLFKHGLELHGLLTLKKNENEIIIYLKE